MRLIYCLPFVDLRYFLLWNGELGLRPRWMGTERRFTHVGGLGPVRCRIDSGPCGLIDPVAVLKKPEEQKRPFWAPEAAVPSSNLNILRRLFAADTIGHVHFELHVSPLKRVRDARSLQEAIEAVADAPFVVTHSDDMAPRALIDAMANLRAAYHQESIRTSHAWDTQKARREDIKHDSARAVLPITTGSPFWVLVGGDGGLCDESGYAYSHPASELARMACVQLSLRGAPTLLWHIRGDADEAAASISRDLCALTARFLEVVSLADAIKMLPGTMQENISANYLTEYLKYQHRELNMAKADGWPGCVLPAIARAFELKDDVLDQLRSLSDFNAQKGPVAGLRGTMSAVLQHAEKIIMIKNDGGNILINTGRITGGITQTAQAVAKADIDESVQKAMAELAALLVRAIESQALSSEAGLQAQKYMKDLGSEVQEKKPDAGVVKTHANRVLEILKTTAEYAAPATKIVGALVGLFV